MARFSEVKLNDEIYSLVFGLGKVRFVLAKALRLDGYYVFEVEYNNGQRVHYTEDGKPNWCQDLTSCTSTIYYKDDIDFDEIDTKAKKKILPKNKILKFRSQGTLEMMSPAGAWVDAYLMPDMMVNSAISNGDFHLFRKMKKISSED